VISLVAIEKKDNNNKRRAEKYTASDTKKLIVEKLDCHLQLTLFELMTYLL
jgi:hypothetical protein